MELRGLLRALGAVRVGGASVREWSFQWIESRRLHLGTKDRQTGGPHAPLGISESCGVRYLLVWTDGRVSRGYLERAQVEEGAGRALERARYTAHEDPDAREVLGPAPIPEVPLHDAGTAAIAGGDTSPLAERLDHLRESFRSLGFRTWSGGFSAAESASCVRTSAGLDAASAATTWGWHATYDGELTSGYAARAPEPFGEYEARLSRLAEWTGRLRDRTSCRAGATDRVLLHPDVVESFVLETLFRNLDGAAVAHGESRFLPRDFGSGKPAVRPDLALRVDPTLPLRAGSYRVTHEGLPASRCSFIEDGRLETPVLDLKYARRLGRAPTPLPSAWDTVFLEGPVPVSLDEALATAEGGALVLRVLGVHTQDPASGDFSLSAPQSLAIASGVARGRLRLTLSGNLFDVLRDEALRLVRFDGERTPGLLVRCRVESA